MEHINAPGGGGDPSVATFLQHLQMTPLASTTTSTNLKSLSNSVTIGKGSNKILPHIDLTLECIKLHINTHN